MKHNVWLIKHWRSKNEKQKAYDYAAIFRSAIGWILFNLKEKYFSDISHIYPIYSNIIFDVEYDGTL